MMDASRKTDSPRTFEKVADRLTNRAARSDFYFLPEPWIGELIARVERKLQATAHSDIALIDVMGKHMLFGYAKRLRPLFVMLGQLIFGGELTDATVDMAAAVELIHCASLFHDDVIDSAQFRKGRRAANAVWGNRSAVIMGDHFFVLAYTLISSKRDHQLLDLFVKTCRTLAEGVILEIKHTGDLSISESTLLDIITRKTATFFGDAARIGGYLAGASAEDQNSLARMGLNFGLAFQLSDDLLDLFADPSATGKSKGSDLTSGIYTTSVIHAMETDPDFIRTFGEMLSGNELTSGEIEMIAEAIRENGSLEYTRGLVQGYSEKALECLEKLPQEKANDAFRALVHVVADREY